MYRKESCPSLLDHDVHEPEYDDGKREMTWHKVTVHTLGRCWSPIIHQDFTIADTIHVLVAALGCSDLRQEVATSAEAQACFADLL
jgi:hypothetical protein